MKGIFTSVFRPPSERETRGLSDLPPVGDANPNFNGINTRNGTLNQEGMKRANQTRVSDEAPGQNEDVTTCPPKESGGAHSHPVDRTPRPISSEGSQRPIELFQLPLTESRSTLILPTAHSKQKKDHGSIETRASKTEIDVKDTV